MKKKDLRAKFSAINSPSQPVITRWKSLLKAAKYCAKNFSKVCEIVNVYEGSEKFVVKAKEGFPAESLLRSLREIYQRYIKLVDEIQKTEILYLKNNEDLELI